MINTVRVLQNLLLAMMVTGLFACNSETHNSNKITEKSSSKLTHKYPGKPQPPVNMKFKFTSTKSFAVGESTDIELTFKTRTVVDDLVIQLSADSGLTLMNSSNQYSLGPQQKGDKSVLDLTVNPDAEGYYYIYITATLVTGDIKQTRNFAIPMNVGNVDPTKHMKPAGIVQEDSTGQKIISMPASSPKK